ncbi:hypothetical protein V8B97DRAFT_1914692 [Scleroderma yunnanense]
MVRPTCSQNFLVEVKCCISTSSEEYAREKAIPFLSDVFCIKLISAQAQADAILGGRQQFTYTYHCEYFEGCTHRFALHGDLFIPQVKAGREGSFEASVKFLKQFLTQDETDVRSDEIEKDGIRITATVGTLEVGCDNVTSTAKLNAGDVGDPQGMIHGGNSREGGIDVSSAAFLAHPTVNDFNIRVPHLLEIYSHPSSGDGTLLPQRIKGRRRLLVALNNFNMAKPTSLAIHTFQAPIVSIKENDSLSVSPTEHKRLELVRVPRGPGIQPELFTLTLVEGDRTYAIRIGKTHLREADKRVIADNEGNAQHWLITSESNRAYSIRKAQSNLAWAFDSRGRVYLKELDQNPSNDQLFRFEIV